MSIVSTTIALRIDLLTHIWQETLQFEGIGPEDNFFDLGGDSALAIQLFTKIAQSCGQQLPPVMIYHVPTIAQQAELLDRPSTPELSPLVLLKSGGQHPSLFIAPGLGGGPAECFQLAKYMDVPNSIYGLQAKGIEGFDEPCDRIDDMAEFYLRGIMRLQPHDPYILVGYSLGGLVALEMGRTLLARGNKVPLVVMIDSYPHKNFLSRRQRLALMAQKTKIRIENFGWVPRSEVRLGGLPSREAISTFAPAFGRVRESAFVALSHYKPAFYPGTVKFIRAAEITDFPQNPAAVWSDLIEDLEVKTVPGDHLGMLTAHYDKLAGVLSRYISEVASIR